MTPYSLARTIAAAVAQDSALQAWATDQFDTALTVYLGLPSADFPDVETDAPFVAFGDPTRNASRGRREVPHGLMAWMGLRVTGDASPEVENLVEPAGLALIGAGVQLLLDAVAAALPANVEITGADQATDTLGAHDWVEGFLALEFEHRLGIGKDPID